MYELFSLFGCLVIPIVVIIAIAVLVRRANKTPANTNTTLLSVMRHQIDAWVGGGRISLENAAPVLRVIDEELARASSAAPVKQPAVVPAQPTAVPAAPVPRPVAAAPVAAAPVASPPVAPEAKEAQPSWADRVWAGVLALRTRQMLLFLGAFLLLISSLVLVVFNWDNFPAPLQCLLLASVCGGLWFAGEWLDRRWGMSSAGAGLRAVSGVLAPVVAFAITQLLGLKLHHAWLLTSLVSVPLYIWAVWRTRQPLFSVAGSLAGASAIMAACGFFSWSALPAVLGIGLVGYLPLAKKLRGIDKQLANGPFWVAHTLMPAAMFVGGGLYLGGMLDLGWLGAALSVGVLFYAVATLVDRRAVWTWSAGALGPLALLAVLGEFVPDQAVLWAASLVGLFTLYLIVSRWLRKQGMLAHANGLAIIAHMLTPAALVFAGLLGWGSGEGALVLWMGVSFYVVAVLIAPVARWSVLAALSAAAALVATFAATGFSEHRVVELALLALAGVYLGLGRWLRGSHRAALAVGPLSVAHVGVPVILAVTYLTLTMNWADVALLWGITAFYGLALGLDRYARWLWPVLVVAALAWVQTGAVFDLGETTINTTLACIALGYLALAVAIEPRARAFALPGYCVGILLGALVGLVAWGQGVTSLQWSLPILVGCCGLLVVATHKQRGSWLAPFGLAFLASSLLAVGSFLVAAWLWVLLDLSLDSPWRAVGLLVLPAIAFVAARTWPGGLRNGYRLALRSVGVVLACMFGYLALGQRDAAVLGMGVLAAVWLLQLCLQRHPAWATLMLSTAAVTVGLALARFAAPDAVWFLSGVLLAFAYTLGAARARQTNWQCLVWPGTLIGTLLGGMVLWAVVRTLPMPNSLAGYHVAAVLALAALAAAHSAIWRRAWLGYVAGPLLALAVVLAASLGFFLEWQPQLADYAYVLCGLTVLLLAIGEAVRRFAPLYAPPYELLAGALIVAAPLVAGVDPQHATGTWLSFALVCGYVTFRHRQRWGMLPALLAADVALVCGARWVWPGVSFSGASSLLVGAAWAQALVALNARRFWAALRKPVYLATAATSCAALSFAAFGSLVDAFNGGSYALPLMVAGFGLAALLALIASVERWEFVGWGALGLLAIGLASLHVELGIEPAWSMSYGVMEALFLLVIGWALDVVVKRGGRAAGAPGIWQRVLLVGPLVAAVGLALLVTVASLSESSQSAAVFALVMLGLVFATVAVRQRSIGFAYAAGGVLVAAALLQLFDWGVREPQGYVVPAGLYLIALADGLRRFQGRRQLSRLIECAALTLMLGTAATQAVEAEGVRTLVLTVVLCAEALLLLAYGSVRQLQVPFVGGAAGFMFGVLWLGVDPVRAANTWVVMGLLGLGLVGLYVLLERRQDQLVQAGRAWIERVSAWG